MVVTVLEAEQVLEHHVDAEDSGARTPLHFAAAGGNMDSVVALVEAKADPSVLDASMDSPAAMAREHGHVAVADYLESLTNPVSTDAVVLDLPSPIPKENKRATMSHEVRVLCLSPPLLCRLER